MIAGATPMAHSTPGILGSRSPIAAGEDLQDLLAKAAEVQSLRSEKASLAGGRWLSKKNMRGFNQVQASTDIIKWR